MYKYYYCDQINDEIFNNKITMDKFNDLIDRYKLVCKDKVKEYWINNVMILSNNSNVTFNKIIDKEILFDNNYLIQELVMNECKPFNFHITDLELEYILYENTINDIKIILKKYNDYITLEYETDNLINIDNFLY